MKIMVWTALFLPDVGGIETLLGQLLPELKKRGHEIILVTSHGRISMPDETVFDGIPVYRFHFRQSIEKRDLSQFIAIQQSISKLKKNFQPDIVHLNFPDPSAYFHLSTQNDYPAQVLLTLHSGHAGILSKYKKKSLFERLLCEATWVTAVSEMTISEVRSFVPSLIKNSSVVYNGVNLPSKMPSLLSFSPPHILCAGRLVAQKGFHYAIEAFTFICKKFPNAIMTIVGDGILRDELVQQAADCGIQKQIHFLGEVNPEEISYHMEKATVLLLTSEIEALGMILLEAGAMGRPAVATDVGGVSEAILHGETGLLVRPGNSIDLADTVIELLSNPRKAQTMADAARAYIEEKRSLGACTSSYEQLYSKFA